MKISILTPDLSHNCIGRAYLLAKILQRHYEVEIVGPMFGNGIWEPIANDKEISYKSIKITGKFKPYWQIRELNKIVSGKVIYASKPLFTSFGIGLIKKIFNKRQLILDIDDWQMGFIKEIYKDLSFLSYFKSLVKSIVEFYKPSSYWNNFIGERLTFLANEITVSNTFLQKKFGGTIVYHGRDIIKFNPENFDKNLIKEKYKIDKHKKIVMFFGSPTPYKGIDDLIEAVKLIKEPDVILVVIGIDDKDKYCKDLVRVAKILLKERFIGFQLQLFDKIPEFLAMADVIVIPQKVNFATVGQIPAKVFDAMAMAKPIIATNVSDLPEILDGCGWILEPKNPKKLAETIQYVLNNYNESEEMGRKARQKCIEKYSWDAIEKVLEKVFRKYE